MKELLLLFVIALSWRRIACLKTYQPTWESLDARPIPEWFDDAKFGIFIHWGIFSVPAWATEGMIAEWYYQRLLTGSDGNATRQFHARTYGADFSYDQFGSMFKAELWDPAQWAELFKSAGAKYVVLTSKHCDGWANWKSPAKWNYNSVDSGPMRDLVGELTNATRAAGLKMGLYYCNIEWGNPLLPWDYERGPVPYSGQEKYVDEVFLTELMDIVQKYEPSIVNGDYCVLLNSTQLRSRDFLAWLYNESPVKDEVVVDDRWGTDARCHHGGYWTCHDKFEPNYVPPHKWMDENTVGISWGLNRMEIEKDYKTVADLVKMLVSNVAYGGNVLLNVGPTSDGRIIPIMEERLRGLGQWLLVNGEAIYATKLWRNQSEIIISGSGSFGAGTTRLGKTSVQNSTVYYTASKAKAGTVYATMIGELPLTGNFTLTLPKPSESTQVHLLNSGGMYTLNWKKGMENMGIFIELGEPDPHSFPDGDGYVFILTDVE